MSSIQAISGYHFTLVNFFFLIEMSWGSKKLVKKIEIFRKEDQEKEIQIIQENNQVMSKYGELL